MTSLVLGGNGQIGWELMRALASLGDVQATTRSGILPDGRGCLQADFVDAAAVVAVLDAQRPTRVVNAAAYTAVDQAESDAASARSANTITPGAVARWCAAHDVPLVHYSTDYVFDGEGTRPYRPDDATAPLGIYGATKLAGEEAIRAAGGRHLIFRTAWVYGPRGKNFLRTMLRAGAERAVVRVVADQIGTPTPAALVADVTARILQAGGAASGTWHLTAAGETSWHGFAEAIFEGALARRLITRAPKIEAITTADYPTPAKRPAYSRLDVASLERDFAITLPQWGDALGEVLDVLAASRD